MGMTAGVWVRVALIVGAIGLAGLRDVTKPARADGPGTSFSIDLDTVQSGIQATRSLPVGTPFSVALVLDATDVPQWFEVDAWIIYDDLHLTPPASGIPLDWSDPPEPGPIGGRTAPFTGDFVCPPFDAATAVFNEDNIGTAWFNMGCYSTQEPNVIPLSYTGSVFEVVLRCDSTGPAAITISNVPGDNFVLDMDLNPHNDHQHGATVTCTPGGGDADMDGMPDVYESQYVCLNVSIADATADPDADEYVNITEYQVGTNPCDLDTDNDGCADSEEDPSRSPMIGGQRDPANGYDFYDVNGTKKVDGADIGLVRVNFNGSGPTPLEDLIYDRSTGAAPWAPNGPDDKINAVDIGIVRTSFNHTCQGPPN